MASFYRNGCIEAPDSSQLESSRCMENSMECLNCGKGIADGSRFCGNCGAPAPVDCEACGAHNLSTKNFCGDCGTRLSDNADAPRAAAAEHRQVTVLFCDLV